jgi:hypothetical protein
MDMRWQYGLLIGRCPTNSGRTGNAKRLIAAAEEVLRVQGMHVIAALIESWNEASLALFQQEGYLPHHAGGRRPADSGQVSLRAGRVLGDAGAVYAGAFSG